MFNHCAAALCEPRGERDPVPGRDDVRHAHCHRSVRCGREDQKEIISKEH